MHLATGLEVLDRAGEGLQRLLPVHNLERLDCRNNNFFFCRNNGAALQAEPHVGIATFVPNELMNYAFMMKVVEYMAAGLPVIGKKIGETQRIIEKHDCGKIIHYKVEEFVEAATKF